MKAKLLLVANTFLFLLATLGLASIQSTVWYQWFGSTPGPVLWLPVIVYLSLYRDSIDALINIYFVAFTVAAMSSIPVGLIMALSLVIFITLSVLKERIFWPGITYFMLATAISIVSFHLSHLVLSWIFEPNPIESPEYLGWIAQLLYTPLLAPFIYRLLVWLDSLTQKKDTSTAGLTKT